MKHAELVDTDPGFMALLPRLREQIRADEIKMRTVVRDSFKPIADMMANLLNAEQRVFFGTYMERFAVVVTANLIRLQLPMYQMLDEVACRVDEESAKILEQLPPASDRKM